MIDRSQPIKGVVEGIGWGVLDEERINLPRSVPYVPRSLNWVRVAQRFAVRVRLQNPPEHLMRLGASAIVEVKHGEAKLRHERSFTYGFSSGFRQGCRSA
jgi:membrane fusion protein, multidrug efflux system